MKKSSLGINPLLILGIWILLILNISLFAKRNIPFTPTFPYHQQLDTYPKVLAPAGYFDGVNYLRIAASGYPNGGGEVAFFPLYPLLIKGLINLGFSPFVGASIITLFSLLLFVLILHEMYPKKSPLILLLLLSFPTSFFLISLYTESLYLLLLLLVIYFSNKDKFLSASLVLSLLTATRLVGVGAIIYLLYALKRKSVSFAKSLAFLSISLSGVISYMIFLKFKFGDYLAFVHAQPKFGMGRSGGEIISLPQVVYRYIRIFLTVSPTELVYWRAAWELATLIFFLIIIFKFFKRLTTPERWYSIWALFLPTLSGTLSSYPRYVLSAFPLFVALATFVKPNNIFLLSTLQLSILIFNLILFTSGLFVA